MSPKKTLVETAKVGTLYMQIMHFCKKEIGNSAHQIMTRRHVPNLLITKKNFRFRLSQRRALQHVHGAKNNLEWSHRIGVLFPQRMSTQGFLNIKSSPDCPTANECR